MGLGQLRATMPAYGLLVLAAEMSMPLVLLKWTRGGLLLRWTRADSSATMHINTGLMQAAACT